MAAGADKSLAIPLRLLLHVPVPWVFVLTYLIGVLLTDVCGDEYVRYQQHARRWL